MHQQENCLVSVEHKCRFWVTIIMKYIVYVIQFKYVRSYVSIDTSKFDVKCIAFRFPFVSRHQTHERYHTIR